MNTKDLKLEIEEIVKAGEKAGVDVCIDEKNFIDKEHLDCFWYGGYLGSVTYRDYSIDIEVHGDVRATIFDKDGNEEYHYVNKNNDGAYSYSEVRNLIKNDAELYTFIKNGKICCEDNNWVEIFLRDAEGEDSGEGGQAGGQERPLPLRKRQEVQELPRQDGTVNNNHRRYAENSRPGSERQ